MSDFQSIDDDWKAKAEEERKKLQEKIEKEGKKEPTLPPANFMTLISTFTTQAMLALGEIEIPGAEGRRVDLKMARYAIDSLGVIQEKTKGNLTDDEKKALDGVLQDLRLRFVQKTKEQGKVQTPESPKES